MRELETSLQQFGEFLLKARPVGRTPLATASTVAAPAVGRGLMRAAHGYRAEYGFSIARSAAVAGRIETAAPPPGASASFSTVRASTRPLLMT